MDNLTVGIRVEENTYSLPPESIFSMAARNNPKRSYLFVSKLIGKHIPVHPGIPFSTGFLLASRLAQTLGISVSKEKINEAVNILLYNLAFSFKGHSYHIPGKALFIGFAETATALGHSVFSSFTGNHHYLHTTRENLEGSRDTIYFSEDHCHAPDQRCLVNDINLFKDNDLLVLIDDEITSGNTCLNIIKTIQLKYPQKKYAVLTILDWRSEKAREKYSQVERELGVEIKVISLLKGRFYAEGDSPVINNHLSTISGTVTGVNMLSQEMGFETHTTCLNGEKVTYLGPTGRFGINGRDHSCLYGKAREIGRELSAVRKGKKTLCLGTGEFMYIPFLISLHMGEGVLVQSTTRSPVHPHPEEEYAVKHAITFEDPFRPGIKNFIYNIPSDHYEEVFVFWERKVLPEQVAPLVQSLRGAGIDKIVFVNFCN